MGTLRSLLHAAGALASLALSVLAALLVTLVLGILLWVRSDGSLQHAIDLAQTLLPAGQSLQATQVSGNLRDGGQVTWLRWAKGGLSVDVHDLDVAWDWHALLDGELRVARLHARLVQVADSGPASTTALSEWVLPMQADLQFAVDRLEWAGPPVLLLEQLQGHYRFDGTTHRLQGASVQMAAGRYSGGGSLQARAPMALSLQLEGAVQVPSTLPAASSAKPATKVPAAWQVPLQLVASANGRLLGPDAQVALTLALQPQDQGKGRPLSATRANLQAQLRPGQAQPIASAQAHWTALDLASLWPQAPQTSLSGRAQVLPDSVGWRATIQLQNATPGTIDRQRLPLRSAEASVLYRNSQWLLSSLNAAVAGGNLKAEGSYGGTPALSQGVQWAAKGSVQGLEPAQIDSRWLLPALSGDLAARQADQGIAFEANLSAPRKGSGPDIPNIPKTPDTRLQASGHWSAPVLRLDSLALQTPQAELSGKLLFDTQSYATTAQLQAKAPGAQATLDGTAGPTAGQGSSVWRVTDAKALTQWLATLPGVGPDLASSTLTGSAELGAQWSGGWQQTGQSVQLRGKARQGETQMDLQSSLQLGQRSAGQWQGRVDTLQLSAGDAQQRAPWLLQLQAPVALDWRSTALAQSFGLAAGAAQLSGPAASTAQLVWQPLQWSRQVPAGRAERSTRWSSKGQLQGLPLAWLELLGQTQLSNLGLRGDLLFGGQWDASSEGAGGLRLRAGLQRSSGDLQLLGAEQSGTALQAGLQDAHLNLAIDNQALQARLVWASTSAGTAQLDFSTRVQTAGGSFGWAPDAPLQGTVQANLPRVGLWSLLAPVGWRIQGTLEANATLAGTRSQPVWKGTLAARDMAVRSVVDGIDFSQGLMRLQVDGQHLEIAELTFLGAGGAAGGRLQISGSADWLPGSTDLPVANRLRMALDAKAQGFRVSARPDQRLVVSGNLTAQLQNARLVVRGALLADQALFVLPEDTAPRLGADVVVNRPTPPVAKTKARSASTSSAPRLAQTVVPDISITLDPGNSFLLQGHGINTRLAGLLTLKAEGLNAAPRLTGELRTVSGTYRAYGQRLNIDSGTLRFNGPYDNPSLDILALRPNLQQVVGVQVSGTAELPVLRLYSDPDLPDADKLSWLVLGRASSNGGAETAMLQQAALALLAGNGKPRTESLVNAFGLDEVSLGRAATTNLDGTAGSEATVKLGKRLSRDFYVAFERSLSGTLGTFYVFYDLSRRLTLRAESGAQSAVDLIFTSRFD